MCSFPIGESLGTLFHGKLWFQGVVGGVLIVTPNNIMFDPHKSDPLVIENGCEEYGLICPMEELVSVALYDDVSRMKLKDALPS